jgi:hypothetical protein
MQTLRQSVRDALPPQDSMLPWLILLTMGWLCVYGVFAFGFDRQLRRLVSLNPLVYPESLISKSSILANYFTSTLSFFIAVLADITVAREFRKISHEDVHKDLVQGPVLPQTDFYYYCFLAYVIYDTIYETLLSETPKLDFIMIGHHALYFLCTLLLYLSDSLVLLTAVLMAQEFSTPFVNAMHVMKIYGLESHSLFTVNAAVMTLSFFAFRVVLPVLAIVHVFVNAGPFTGQGAGFLGFSSGESVARTIALALVLAGQCMQFFWFWKIVRGLLRHISGKQIPESANEDDKLIDRDVKVPLINPDEGAGVF